MYTAHDDRCELDMPGNFLPCACPRKRGIRFRVAFKWYDMWIGAFWDRKTRTLYICPLPCVVLIFGGE